MYLILPHTNTRIFRCARVRYQEVSHTILTLAWTTLPSDSRVTISRDSSRAYLSINLSLQLLYIHCTAELFRNTLPINYRTMEKLP